jgi:hypothetical protein
MLFLLLVWGTVGLCGLAIFLGRSTPGLAAHGARRHTPAPPLVGINYCVLGGASVTPAILDTTAGVVTPCTLPGSNDLELLGFSPWCDDDGQYQLIALKKHAASEQFGSGDRAEALFGLTRYRFPGGQVLGQVALDVLPCGQVCWFPDGSDRVLFASADCALRAYDFRTGTKNRDLAPPPRPLPLRWQCAAPGVGEVRLQDPCWHGAPELGGRLLVSASIADGDSGPYAAPLLWWLQIDPDQTTILAAARLIVNEGGSDKGGSSRAPDEERRPCVGRASDGRLLLAYLGRRPEQSAWDLRVAPISVDGSSGAPRIVRSAERTLARGCIALAVAFSADGRSIHVSLRDTQSVGAWGVLRSYPIPSDLFGSIASSVPSQSEPRGALAPRPSPSRFDPER